jgi:hypothetical protein
VISVLPEPSVNIFPHKKFIRILIYRKKTVYLCSRKIPFVTERLREKCVAHKCRLRGLFFCPFGSSGVSRMVFRNKTPMPVNLCPAIGIYSYRCGDIPRIIRRETRCARIASCYQLLFLTSREKPFSSAPACIFALKFDIGNSICDSPKYRSGRHPVAG